MVDAALSFHSWVRRGLANAVSTTALETRTSAAVTVGFNAGETGVTPLSAVASLELIGPGDIVGLDPDVIVRRWPKPDDYDAEFKSYALIEFDQADLLWRYSPESSSTADAQVRPWLTLVVLESTEGTLVEATPEQKLPVLEVNDVRSLPNPDEGWAWGHTQFAGRGLSEDAIRRAVSGAPGRFTARLMSPRLLKANKDYLACLVPTFERGRLIGLHGRDPATIPVLDRWQTSDTTDPKFRLPVYHSWRFKTGSIASFEEAARLIRPVVLPASLGRRDMDVSKPDVRLPAASTASLPVEGALMSVAAAEAPPPTWPDPLRSEFIAELSRLVNAPADARDPELVPPLYGQWYAAASRLLAPRPGGSNPPWFYELNSDPRNRVAAGLGTTVIQNEQQALLASGWEQVGEARSINDQARVLQLARGLLGRVFVRHFSEASLQRFYLLTLRLHGFVTCGDETVCANLGASPIPAGFLSTQWSRWARPRGQIGAIQERQQLALAGFVPDLMERLNRCERPAPEPDPPQLHEPIDPRGGPYCEHIEVLIGLGRDVLLFWGLTILWVVRQLSVSQNGDCWWTALRGFRFGIWLIRIAIDPEQMRTLCRLRLGTLTPAHLQSGPRFPSLSVTGGGLVPNPLPAPPVPGPAGSADSAAIAQIRADLTRLLGLLVPPPRLSCAPGAPLEPCRERLIAELTPEVTVGQVFLERRRVEITWEPRDRLEPLFLPPTYERPMYKPLAQLSSDWILPGLNTMGRDRVGLAVTNQRFVEAYMAGLNHEMTRELLWNEFPTDQRGTYFRQFWDIAAHILEDGSKLPPEQLRDIHPIRLWPKNSPLGGNSPRPRRSGASEFVVLVVRAQLVQKYPNMIVYAQRRDVATGRLSGPQTHPIFYALIDPDTAFYGFDVTVEELRADDRLYFVFQEQPGEPKFADEVTDRSASAYTSPSTPTNLGATAGAVAESTFLDPFRLGISARNLLPRPPSTP